MGTRCANHVTPLYPQKLALTSPTGGGRSVGIVRSRTKATEFSLIQRHSLEFETTNEQKAKGATVVSSVIFTCCLPFRIFGPVRDEVTGEEEIA